MTTTTATNLRIDSEVIEVVDRFCPLKLISNSKGTSIQELHQCFIK